MASTTSNRRSADIRRTTSTSPCSRRSLEQAGRRACARDRASAHAPRLHALFGLIDEGKATKNPARMLPKKTRALIQTDVRSQEDALPRAQEGHRTRLPVATSPYNVAFAISALAGLRPGEVGL